MSEQPAHTTCDLLTQEELIARWKNKVSKGTLKNWRAQGKGPKPTKIGGSVFYSLAQVEDYEKRQTRE